MKFSLQFLSVNYRSSNTHFLKQERASLFRALSIKSSKKPMESSCLAGLSRVSYTTNQGSNSFPNSIIRESFIIPIERDIKLVHSSELKQIMTKILVNKFFEMFMFLVALLSLILISQDTPLINPLSPLIQNLDKLEIAISAIYVTEFLIKIWVLGIFQGKNSYFQQSFFNFIDFFNVILSLLFICQIKDSKRALHILKSIRAFKIIKIILFSNKDLNIMGDCIVNSFIYVIKLLFFYGIFIFCFSLFAMKYLKGTMFRCVNIDKEFHINTRQDCFDHGGSWINSDTPFDNIMIAFFTLFEVSTSEGWSFIM